MTEGKMIQEMVGAISWAKNGAFSEKKCQKIAVDAAKAYADAKVAEAKNNDPFYTPRLQLHMRISGLMAEIAALKAANERMREGISDIDIIMDDSNLSISEARHAVFSKVQSLLSPVDTSEDDTDEPHSFDPEFCPNCKTTEWYHGDRINHYGCHNCGVDFVHIDSPADGDGVAFESTMPEIFTDPNSPTFSQTRDGVK